MTNPIKNVMKILRGSHNLSSELTKLEARSCEKVILWTCSLRAALGKKNVILCVRSDLRCLILCCSTLLPFGFTYVLIVYFPRNFQVLDHRTVSLHFSSGTVLDVQ